MFKGIVELEALDRDHVINKLHVVSRITEHHPEADIKTWTVLHVEVPDERIAQVTEELSGQMKSGWYSIFWNNDKIYVVLTNKVFGMPRDYRNSKPYNDFRAYAIGNGIQEEYLEFDID
jgi:hypothetical protein